MNKGETPIEVSPNYRFTEIFLFFEEKTWQILDKKLKEDEHLQ